MINYWTRLKQNFCKGSIYSKDKIKSQCEHQVDQNDNMDVHTHKCMKQLKQQFLECQHEVEYYCFEKDKLSDKCHYVCDKLLPCGDRCKKKCYENCLPCINNCEKQIKLNLCEHFLESKNVNQEQQSQCNQEVKVLLDCGHTTIFKCWQKEELQKSYNCKETCIKKRICGHSFNKCKNYCFQQQCSPCLQKITINFDCGHELQIQCYQKDDYIQCNNKCNQDKQKQNPKNQINIPLNCGHTVQTTFDQKDSILQSFKCKEKCKKKRLCQHDQECDNFCYQECTPCKELIEVELSCKHKAKFQCFNAKQEQQNYKCTQPCNKNRPCHHLDPCLKECGDHICTPCQQIVPKVFPSCAHEAEVVCFEMVCLKNQVCKQCSEKNKCRVQ